MYEGEQKIKAMTLTGKNRHTHK